jgi:spermidine/putrescine transport system substrate-binding protein
MSILCWEGYNSAQVLDPFRKKEGATVKAETLTNDPAMIARLRAAETNIWDLINVNAEPLLPLVANSCYNLWVSDNSR